MCSRGSLTGITLGCVLGWFFLLPGFTMELDGGVWSQALNEWPFLHCRESLLPHGTPFQVQEKVRVGGSYGLCGCAIFMINS